MFSEKADFVSISKSTKCINALLSNNDASTFNLPSSEIDRFFNEFSMLLEPFGSAIDYDGYHLKKGEKITLIFHNCESLDKDYHRPHNFKSKSYEVHH